MELLSRIFHYFDLSTLFVGVVILILILWLKDVQHGRHMPPGPIQWPIVGSLPSLALFGRKDPVAYMKQMGDKYGGLFSLKFGDNFAVVITDYNIMKEALIKQGDIFSTRPKMGIAQASPTGNDAHHGVILANGRSWQVFRRFSIQAMRDFGLGKKSLEEKIKIEAMSLVKEFDGKNGKPLDPSNKTQMALTNIICAMVFGERYEYGDPDLAKIRSSVRQMTQAVPFTDIRNIFKVLNLLPFPDNVNKMLDATRDLAQLIESQIAKHRKTLDANEDRDILDLCIKKQNSGGIDAEFFNDDKIPNFVRDLIIAGSDSSSTTLSWAYLYMVQNPVVQEKCFQEIDKVLGDRLPTMADRTNLPFVDATLSEIQRIRTTVPMSVIHSTSDEATLNGYCIPKGTWVFPLLHGVNTDEQHWKEPTEFNPERFIDESGKYVRNEALIPFSVGPRTCAGEILAKMQLFLFFTIMLQKFRFSKASSDQAIDFNPILGVTWSSTPQNIRMTRRCDDNNNDNNKG